MEKLIERLRESDDLLCDEAAKAIENLTKADPVETKITLQNLLELIPEGETVIVIGSADVSVTGTVESLNAMLDLTVMNMQVINIEVKHEALQIWVEFD